MYGQSVGINIDDLQYRFISENPDVYQSIIYSVNRYDILNAF